MTARGRSNGDDRRRLERASELTQMGAPVLEAFPPPAGSPAGMFHQWLERRRDVVGSLLGRLTEKWNPLGCFVEVNFTHPEMGPAGAVVMTTQTIDTNPLRRRVARVMVIPFDELRAYLPSWERGATVLLSVDDMPPPLARRYAPTPVKWSLNVPIHVEGEWVGLVGAIADESGFTAAAVSSFEGLARVLMRDFAADSAWSVFRETIAEEPRLRLLRD